LIRIQVFGVPQAVAKFAALGVASKAAGAGIVASGAAEVEQAAKARAPVLTGALRDSIHTETDSEGARVGTSIPYAAPVEFGTSDTPAQPFLRPAADQAAPGFARAASVLLARLFR